MKRLTPDELANNLERVAQGDVASFVKVYHATAMKLFGIVVRILGKGELADEVLQEVYLQVWRRAADYNATRASAITWLATIARNRALDETRRRRTDSLEDMPELLELPSDVNIIGEHLANDELRRLRHCIDQLEPNQREVLQLVYFEGLTRENVAALVRQPVATVKTWLKRSLAGLKGCLDP